MTKPPDRPSGGWMKVLWLSVVVLVVNAAGFISLPAPLVVMVVCVFGAALIGVVTEILDGTH